MQEDPEVLGRVLPSPFFSSFVGRARKGDLRDSDPARRAAHWAHWAVRSARTFFGAAERSYVGLVLPGRFHDPFGSAPTSPPHLEVSSSRLARSDQEFPDRLAQMGNGLLFPWWVFQEVTAVRRALFVASPASVAPFCDAIAHLRSSLSDTLSADSSRFAGLWQHVEHALVADPQLVSPLVVEPFSEEDVAALAPSLAELKVSVEFEPRLLEASGPRAARRLGVWIVSGDAGDGAFRLGVVSPRLTANSLFRDPSFSASSESPSALLVRLLLVRRMASGLAGVTLPGRVTPDLPPGRQPFLRAVPAQPGAKLPEASVASAVHFLQAFPDADAAWALLSSWADSGFVLTVSRESFVSAHSNALRFVRRAETPSRDDTNTILPLAWDSSARVVRVTFVRPS